ncbi:MAG: DASS family sodium-coupled anion symporter [Candidatus Krumholzibacteriia bacterium]
MILRSPKRLAPFLLGLLLFGGILWAPAFPDAVDPSGHSVPLSHQAKAALGLFLLAGVWWVFEVIPVGVTAIAIGVVQSLWLIREPRTALTDFMDPSVWFIFGSLLIGSAFVKTGLTRRMAFAVLTRISESTRLIYLGVFALTAFLTLFMAHTAVAAAIFPLLLVIHNQYESGGRRTVFGKGLFIGMAYTAGAGSIITLLGAARGAVAIGFFRELTGQEVSFFELSRFMFPLGAAMVLLLWGFICLVCPPERDRLPGLRQRARDLARAQGRMTRKEWATLAITLAVMGLLTLRSFAPALAGLDKSAVILSAILLFFILDILTLKDLEAVPWNIVLLFGGAMSIGFCLWQTGAAEWMAIGWLSWFEEAPWLVFIMGIAVFVLVMTNFIMNVAAIAITLPVALVMAPHIGVEPEIVMFAALAAAGMPFMLLVGAAPNAIAFESGQFRTREFFLYGIPASLLLLGVLTLFVWKIWPWMGMPVLMGS